MKRINELLNRGGGEYWFWGKSALDRYFGQEPAFINIATTSSLSDLAKKFDNLTFPRLEDGDALLEFDGVSLLFTLVDNINGIPLFNVSPLNFLYSLCENKFIDRMGEYGVLRRGCLEGLTLSRRDWEHCLRQTAWMPEDLDRREKWDFSPDPPESFLRERDRFFLSDILTGPHARNALELLYAKGWIQALLPELGLLTGIEQNKEFHPEGNVWEHTLETLKYRKERPVNLSLALFFHDLGKAQAEEVGGNRFHGHAQIGARQAGRIMEDWEFPGPLIEDVTYLVSHHMMPAAIDALPYYKKKEVIEDPLFPLLLELYRCDLSSSFHGLDAYYEACRSYRGFMKNKRNPYRKADGSLIRGAL